MDNHEYLKCYMNTESYAAAYLQWLEFHACVGVSYGIFVLKLASLRTDDFALLAEEVAGG